MHIIGNENTGRGPDRFFSFNPSLQQNNEYSFYRATTDEVNSAVEKAHVAFDSYRKKTGLVKADFLQAIANNILNNEEDLVTVCQQETALPAARIESERLRTVNQLHMFANLLREGSWVNAVIDTAIPSRTPVPKPDLRSMQVSLGPVAIFGASNFPLAFSVAGGDTASALAAGCSVVVKAHPAHPATSAIIGRAIQQAAIETNMPDGVFSLLFDDTIDSGIQLVNHPLIKAVGFTGSFKGGKALYDAAVRRPEPIPVYAEMGSSNPVFILPIAMKERGQEIASGYTTSVTLGVGQFCTNPGLLIHEQDEVFRSLLQTEFNKAIGGVMLSTSIRNAYGKRVEEQLSFQGVELLSGSVNHTGSKHVAAPVLMHTHGKIMNDFPALSEEIFGPAGMVIAASSRDEMIGIAKNLHGHLTATVHGTAEELNEYRELLDVLEQKAGRVIINGFPTGVEVCNAMVHGGPYPSTTDSRSTSVGTAAIYRFTRPVCYQNFPQRLLPGELQDKNPLNIHRIVNGERTKTEIL